MPIVFLTYLLLVPTMAIQRWKPKKLMLTHWIPCIPLPLILNAFSYPLVLFLWLRSRGHVDEELAAIAGHRTEVVFEDTPLEVTRVSPLTLSIHGSADFYPGTSFTVHRISCEPDLPAPSITPIDEGCHSGRISSFRLARGR